MELRYELLLACRDVLLRVGPPQAAAVVAHIGALLDPTTAHRQALSRASPLPSLAGVAAASAD